MSATASSISSMTDAGTSVRVVRRSPATATVCSSVPTIWPSTTPPPDTVTGSDDPAGASSSRSGSRWTSSDGAVTRSSPRSRRSSTSSCSRSVVTRTSDSSTVWPPRSAMIHRTRTGTSSV